MSVRKQKDKYIPTCDICGNTMECEDTRDDAIDAMICEGWQLIRIGDDGQSDIWQDICCDCQESEDESE